ncbi:hypothetical protein CANARDRAFT_27437 [[Candida] arabinofermentans NRRL YB-2248]|uniref:UDENN FLCN/SMCR8-type domain-containing protein n=1 Tax=[Candida] arabinofermentans NRRL YB-2248 TaxID=983967 RepID=A0A1E4T349_9ASCO|nr:hypothetical protein CANARDRAFT_27437 [[Candida] arabinofermentans NRRL YB-2248]
MAFIVTLAHFCEVHGPSMIMCTQTINNKTQDETSYYSPSIPQSQLCKSCCLMIPSKGSSTENSLEQPGGESSSTIRSQVDGVSFLTTQFPTSQVRYSSLRQIIMKVFTVETNLDNSKPVIFGDSNNGYSVALGFKLYDMTARGSERKYSIIVTSESEDELFARYIIVLKHLISIVDFIVTRLSHIIESQSKSDNNNDIFLRRGSRIPKSKSLVEILKDGDFFVKMHKWACSLLLELDT